MFDSLFTKTFLILGSQLLVTFLGALAVLGYIRKLYRDGHYAITAETNEAGQLDLDIDINFIKPYFYGLLVADIALFLILLFKGESNLTIGIPVFTAWSLVTGAEFAIVLISLDENLGAKVLGLTVLATFVAAIVGIYSGIDFGFLSKFLFISLLLLILFGIVRIIFSINRGTQRLGALFGVVVFIGYLLFDFNRLTKMSNAGISDWHNAMNMSISIYLDIVNLFLDILDLISD